jgi:hypothetical protein
MARFIMACVILVLVAILLGPAATGQGDGSKTTSPSTVVVTGKDFGRVFRAKNGDTIELRLDSTLPYKWELIENNSVLVALPSSSLPPNRGPGGSAPKLGGSRLSVHRYKVSTSRNMSFTPQWMYCFGDLETTRMREQENKVPPHGNFSPELQPNQIKEGMIFRVKLELRP